MNILPTYNTIFLPIKIIFIIVFFLCTKRLKKLLIVLILVIVLLIALFIINDLNSLSFFNYYLNINTYLGSNLKTDYINTKTTLNKKIYIGDSRTVGMYFALYGGTNDFVFEEKENIIWYAKVSKGFNWFSKEAMPKIEKYLNNDNYDVIMLMGTNDLYDTNIAIKYIEIIQDFANRFHDSNFIVISVNPINDLNAAQKGYFVNDSDVIKFNEVYKNSINSTNQKNLSYCDTYSFIKDNFISQDGIHYDKETYKKIFELTQNCM